MYSTKEIVKNIIIANNIPTVKLINVKQEDAESTENVKHICRNGVTYLNKQVYSIPIPTQRGHGFVQVPFICYIWNCPNCGKTYYSKINN